ncbi:MAG: hypothetical protein QM758_13200 [Armatimonas sp.]
MLRRTFLMSLAPYLLLQEKPEQVVPPPSYRIVDLGVVGRRGTPDLLALWRQRQKARASALERLNKPARRISIDPDAPAPIAKDWPISLVDINDSGVAVGSVLYAVGGNDIEVQDPVLWKDGKPILLEGLGGRDEAAYSINNRGQIVGSAGGRGSASGSRPCLWLDQKPYDLNLLIPSRSGWKLKDTMVLIDDRGQILVQGQFKGKEHVARLIPGA